MRVALSLSEVPEVEESVNRLPKRAARKVLREATRAEHERVDSLPLMRRLLHERVSRTDYGNALERLMLLHASMSAELAASVAEFAHPRLRAGDLLPALSSDLAELHWRITRKPEPAPQFTSGAEALGAWYVLEGAALGGAVIARHLRQCLGPDLPLRHFGRGDERRWPEFIRHLESSLNSSAALEAAVHGARSAYRFAAETLVA